MKKFKEKMTMGPKNIKWWKCKDEIMVDYRERVRMKYEELDAETGTVEGEWRQYNDAFVGVADELCGRTSGGKEVRREEETKDGGRKRWRRHGREAGSMEDDRMHPLKAPVWPEEDGSQEGGGQRTKEYGGRTAPKA